MLAQVDANLVGRRVLGSVNSAVCVLFETVRENGAQISMEHNFTYFTRNMPYISFGQKTKPVYEKGFVKELMLSQSPAIKYSPNYEASSLKQSPSKAVIGKGPKFLKTR